MLVDNFGWLYLVMMLCQELSRDIPMDVFSKLILLYADEYYIYNDQRHNENHIEIPI